MKHNLINSDRSQIIVDKKTIEELIFTIGKLEEEINLLKKTHNKIYDV